MTVRNDLCHDFINNIVAVHRHGRVVLLARHLRFPDLKAITQVTNQVPPDRREALVLLARQPPCPLQHLRDTGRKTLEDGTTILDKEDDLL